MKFVLLGSISPSWIGKQAERYKKSNEKLKQLGIKQVSVLYTQGQYDFVETIDAPGPEAILGFTIWYSQTSCIQRTSIYSTFFIFHMYRQHERKKNIRCMEQ